MASGFVTDFGIAQRQILKSISVVLTTLVFFGTDFHIPRVAVIDNGIEYVA